MMRQSENMEEALVRTAVTLKAWALKARALQLSTSRVPTLAGLAAIVYSATCAGQLMADESTWTAAGRWVQLQEDPQLIPKGKGMLFVPAMSVPVGNEPSYQVFNGGGNEISSASPGRSVILSPGRYEVLIGTGAITQKVKKSVEIVAGNTTVLKPDWSALVIDVIDQSRTSINESYEIYQENSQENFGFGSGIEEERGERVRTWILQPGVYNIVKVGQPFSTTRKFSVRLAPGKLVQRNLVFDSNSDEFIGFYPRPTLLGGSAKIAKNITSQTEFSGSTLVNQTQRNPAGDASTLTLSVQVFNRSRYSTEKHFASVRLVMEEGATKQEGVVRKSIDRLELRGTYIYRVSQKFGPYLRGVMNTKLFADEAFFETRDFQKVKANGDVLQTELSTSNVTLSPTFFPLRLRQGIGINSQLLRTFRVNLDVRVGLGARQTLVADSFELSDDEMFATEIQNASSVGFEALLITDARLGKAINLDSEFDILMPSSKTDDWVFSWENRLRIFLTSYISLDLVADLEREETLKRLQGREQILLRFSRFF